MSASPPFVPRAEVVADGRGVELGLDGPGGPLTFGDVQEGWRDAAFAQAFAARLAAEPHQASYWELPPLRRADLGRPFRCVLLDAPELTRLPPDAVTFAEHFDDHRAVVRFDNLGGDAQLVVPAALPDAGQHAHLQVFLREAPAERVQALWAELARAWDERLHEAPIWTSTSGLGVAWLHVRLDRRPKYYQHMPYTRPPEEPRR